MMHIDYAKEVLLEREAPKHSEPFTPQRIIECLVHEPEFLKLVDALGNEKASGIAATVRNSAKSKYAKVTANQKYALAAALLEKHKTARAVYAAAFGVTEAVMFPAPEPEFEFDENVVAIPTVGGIIADTPVSEENRFPAEVQLQVTIEAAKNRSTGWMIVEHKGKGVAVSVNEARKFGLKEVENWLPDLTGVSAVPAPGEIQAHLRTV